MQVNVVRNLVVPLQFGDFQRRDASRQKRSGPGEKPIIHRFFFFHFHTDELTTKVRTVLLIRTQRTGSRRWTFLDIFISGFFSIPKASSSSDPSHRDLKKSHSSRSTKSGKNESPKMCRSAIIVMHNVS